MGGRRLNHVVKPQGGWGEKTHLTVWGDFAFGYHQEVGGCGSGVEPASCYRKVASSIPPGLHVEVSLVKILNPKLLLMCWSASCMAATTISVWKYAWITVSRFGQKHLLNALNVNVSKCRLHIVNYPHRHLDWFPQLCLWDWQPGANFMCFHISIID